MPWFLVGAVVVVGYAVFSIETGVLFVYLSRSERSRQPVRYWVGTLLILFTGVALFYFGLSMNGGWFG